MGFYGGLTSTIPRIYDLARFYKSGGAITVAGGQHFVDETIPEALSSDIDIVALGEGEETIQELLRAFTRGDNLSAVAGDFVNSSKPNVIFGGGDPAKGGSFGVANITQAKANGYLDVYNNTNLSLIHI